MLANFRGVRIVETSPRTSVLAHALTLVTFVCSACAVPALLVSYVVVRTARKLWMKLLSNRFPHLVFVETASVRTLLDTYRNQGVINVLMTIKGPCQPELVRQNLIDHVLEKRDRSGNLLFPKLRAALVSCWGNYAWRKFTPFNLDNHVIAGSAKFRGRPVTDHNIQDYVNEIVTKYLPSENPPWQIIIIPNMLASEQKYFILIRVHHLLVEDDESLNIGDFLLMKPGVGQHLDASECHSTTSRDSDVYEHEAKSPLSDFLETPTALPSLYYRLSDSFSNRWNEFISNYDPIETPKVLRTPPGIFHCAAMLLITYVSVCKDFGKFVSQNNRTDPATYVNYFVSTFHREAARRGISLTTLLNSGLVSFNPLTIVRKMMAILWYVSITCTLKLPVLVYYECMAFLYCLNRQYYAYPNTIIAFLNSYLPLLYSAGKEIFYIGKLIYTAPIILIEELLMRDNPEPHQLQTMSTCGRKVVAWSHHVSRKIVGEIAMAAKVSETEVLLAMTTSCLKEYFHHAALPIPKIVLATARTVSCDTLLASSESNGGHGQIPGIVCLSLPVGDSETRDGIDDVLVMSQEVRRVRKKQGALFALGGKRRLIAKALPSVLARIALNFGSRRFSVALTEVAESADGKHRETRWGHTVLSLMCWRPPQGNIGMSLTIQRYAGVVRLGVMADALLSPLHCAAARHWSRAARRLHARIPPPPPPVTAKTF